MQYAGGAIADFTISGIYSGLDALAFDLLPNQSSSLLGHDAASHYGALTGRAVATGASLWGGFTLIRWGLGLAAGFFQGGRTLLALVYVEGSGVVALTNSTAAGAGAAAATIGAGLAGNGLHLLSKEAQDAPNSSNRSQEPPGRSIGDRMTSKDDALQQFEEIEEAERRSRRGVGNKIIESI